MKTTKNKFKKRELQEKRIVESRLSNGYGIWYG